MPWPSKKAVDRALSAVLGFSLGPAGFPEAASNAVKPPERLVATMTVLQGSRAMKASYS